MERALRCAPARGFDQAWVMVRILVVGRHPDIMRKVTELLASGGYGHLSALEDAEAIALIRSASPDALLLGGGVEPPSRAALRAEFERVHPGAPVIEHFGGPPMAYSTT